MCKPHKIYVELYICSASVNNIFAALDDLAAHAHRRRRLASHSPTHTHAQTLHISHTHTHAHAHARAHAHAPTYRALPASSHHQSAEAVAAAEAAATAASRAHLRRYKIVHACVRVLTCVRSHTYTLNCSARGRSRVLAPIICVIPSMCSRIEATAQCVCLLILACFSDPQ